MMYTDYYALSSCAISVVFVPFMIVCLLRYALILQAYNYETKTYLRWLGCSFLAAWAPLLFISILAMLAQVTLNAYLRHTAATEMMIIIGYALLLLLTCAAIALSFGRFARVLGGACWNVPRIEDGRLVLLFVVSSFLVGIATLLLNVFGRQTILYVLPIATPLLPLFVNLFQKPRPGPVEAKGSGAFEEEEEEDPRFSETKLRINLEDEPTDSGF